MAYPSIMFFVFGLIANLPAMWSVRDTDATTNIAIAEIGAISTFVSLGGNYSRDAARMPNVGSVKVSMAAATVEEGDGGLQHTSVLQVLRPPTGENLHVFMAGQQSKLMYRAIPTWVEDVVRKQPGVEAAVSGPVMFFVSNPPFNVEVEAQEKEKYDFLFEDYGVLPYDEEHVVKHDGKTYSAPYQLALEALFRDNRATLEDAASVAGLSKNLDVLDTTVDEFLHERASIVDPWVDAAIAHCTNAGDSVTVAGLNNFKIYLSAVKSLRLDSWKTNGDKTRLFHVTDEACTVCDPSTGEILGVEDYMQYLREMAFAKFTLPSGEPKPIPDEIASASFTDFVGMLGLNERTCLCTNGASTCTDDNEQTFESGGKQKPLFGPAKKNGRDGMIAWPTKMLEMFKAGGKSTADVLNVILSIAGEADCAGPACAPIITRVNNMLKASEASQDIIMGAIFDLEGDDVQAWILSQAFYSKTFGRRAMPVITQVSSKATGTCGWPIGAPSNVWTADDSTQKTAEKKQGEADIVNEGMPKIVAHLETLPHVTMIGDDDVRFKNQVHVVGAWEKAMK